jgi:hypothetical protein
MTETLYNIHLLFCHSFDVVYIQYMIYTRFTERPFMWRGTSLKESLIYLVLNQKKSCFCARYIKRGGEGGGSARGKERGLP